MVDTQIPLVASLLERVGNSRNSMRTTFLAGQGESFPCLIHEVLCPPDMNVESIKLVEVAGTFHNDAFFEAAINTYNKAMQKITNLSRIHEIFFKLSIGQVYQSEGRDQDALLEFMTAKLILEETDQGKDSLEMSFILNALGIIYTHINQYDIAAEYFYRAGQIREKILSDKHVDTALCYNNLAVCFHFVNKMSDAISLYKASMQVFTDYLGLDHPRTVTTRRNLNLANIKMLRDFKATSLTPVPTGRKDIIPVDPRVLEKPKKKGTKKKGKKAKK